MSYTAILVIIVLVLLLLAGLSMLRGFALRQRRQNESAYWWLDFAGFLTGLAIIAGMAAGGAAYLRL